MKRLILAGVSAILLGAIVAGSPAGAQNAPFAGGGQADAKDPAVEKLEAAAAKLDKQVKAAPKDAKLKMQTADAHYKAGHAMMMSPTLAPRVKYRGALAHYRQALALNPKHKEAATEKKTIEDIYKQMGRPIPQ